MSIVIAALSGSIITTLVILCVFVWATRHRTQSAQDASDETIELMRERNAIDERKVAALWEIRNVLGDIQTSLRK